MTMNSSFKSLCWFLSCLLLEAGASPSIHPGYLSVKHYGLEQGLKNLAVWCSLQDRQGFIWAGTEDGLYRHEGQSFTGFGISHGLPAAYIHCLLEDRKSALWIGTFQGLAVFEQGRIQPIPPEAGLPASNIQALALDARDTLWVGTNLGLYVQTGPRSFSPAPDFPGGAITSLASSPKGQEIWTATWSGSRAAVHAFRQGRWLKLEGEEGFGQEKLDSLILDRQGRLWARSLKKLWLLDEKGRFRTAPFSLPPTRQKAYLGQDNHGRIWIPTDQGLGCFNGKDFHILGPREGLPKRMIRTVLVDREGSLWMGGQGMNRILGGGVWRSYPPALGLPSSYVWALHRDPDGRLLVGTDDGLALSCPEGFQQVPGTQGFQIRTIVPGPKGSYFLAGSPEILHWKPGSPLRRYGAESGVRTAGRIYRLLYDTEGTLWVATFGGGLLKGCTTQDDLRFTPEALPQGHPQEHIEDLFLDSHGRLWVAAMNGLALRDKGVWKRFTVQDGFRQNALAHVRVSRNGDIWLVYFGPHGVARASYRNDRFQIHEHLDRFFPPSQIAYLVGEDARGNIWVGTGAGIYLLSPNRRALRFTAADGLVGNSTNNQSFLAEADGQVWIGTSEGLGRFTPSEQDLFPRPPEAAIVTCAFSDKHQTRTSASPAELPHRFNTLEVRFTPLSFIHEDDLQHRVWLQGLEADWHMTSHLAERYPALPPGAYTFQVASRIGEGEWGPSSQIQFRILPAWYQTWWFKGLGILGLGGLLLLAVRWRTRSLKRRNQELESMVADRTRDLVRANAFKSMFLANTSHELRTPLNAILGLSKLLLEPQIPESERIQFTRTVHRSADGLLHILNDILDLSKIEAGKLVMEQLPFDLRQVLEDALTLIGEKAQGKGLELVGQVDPDVPRTLMGDPGRIRQALINLINNAVKFTQQGYVHCRVELVEIKEQEVLLRFKVQDSGIGIAPEAQGKLFQAYTQAEDSTSRQFGGTGLGLFITRQLAELMSGEAGAESVAGQGSTFWFSARLQIASEQAPDPPARLVGKKVRVQGCSPRVEAHLKQLVHRSGGQWTHLDPADLYIADGLGALETLPNQAKKIVLLPLTHHWDQAHAQGAFVLHHPFGEPSWQQALEFTLGKAGQPDQLPESTWPQFQGRVLVADDNPGNHMLAEALLRRFGLQTEKALNGQEALELIEHEAFDLVFLDGRMPILDGLGTAACIREKEAKVSSSHLPLVALTGSVLPTERQRFLDGGFDAFLPKPLHREALEDILGRFLPRKESLPAVNLSAQVSPDAAPFAHVLDLERLKAMMDSLGGREGLADLVDYFLEDGRQRLDHLRKALDAGDLQNLQTLAHDFKSNSGNLGLKALYETCMELEHHAFDWSAPQIGSALETLAQQLLQAEQALKPFSSDGTSEPKEQD